MLRKLICFIIIIQLLFACDSQESAPISKVQGRGGPEIISIEGVLSTISDLVVSSSYASEVTLYSLERGGEKSILAKSILDTRNRFQLKIEKNKVKNKVILIEVLDSPVGDRSMIINSETNLSLSLNHDNHIKAQEQYEILVMTLSNQEISPQLIFEIAKIHPEYVKIMMEAFNDVAETIQLERGGHLTLTLFVGQIYYVLTNEEAFKALRRRLKKFRDRELDCRGLVYEVHMIYRKWIDNNSVVMFGDCPEELSDLSYVNQSGKELEFELYFTPLSGVAKKIWGENRYRFYRGRGAIFNETIQNFVEKLAHTSSEYNVSFQIELRDIESGRVETCEFRNGQTGELQTWPEFNVESSNSETSVDYQQE